MSNPRVATSPRGPGLLGPAALACILVFLALAASFAPAGAVCWVGQGAPIVTLPATVTVNAPQAVADGAGGMYLVWSDNRTGNYDVYVSRVDATGCVVAGWPQFGAQVSAAAGDQTGPRAVADNAGGLYVVWEDTRSGGGDVQKDLYAQRITSTGVVASGWVPTGMPVSVASQRQSRPALAADGTSGLMVLWMDERGSFGKPYAQKLTAATGAPVWTSGGVKVADLAYTLQIYGDLGQIVPDGSGGAVVAFDDAYGEVFAQRLAASNGAPQWTGDPVYATLHLDSHGFQTSLAADGMGDYYLAYTSYGDQYTLEPQNVNVVRFDNTGTITSGWPKVASGATGDQNYPIAASDGFSGVLVSWRDTRTSGNYQYPDLYATRLGPDGLRPGTCWVADGNAVAAGAGAARGLVSMAGDGKGGAVLVWEQGTDIHANNLRGDATLATETTLSSAVGYQTAPSAVVASPGTAMAVWQDARSGAQNGIYGMNLAYTMASAVPNTAVSVTLVASTGMNVGWTDPADHPTYGPAVLYDLRWSSSGITEANFNLQPLSYQVTPSGVPGTAECATLVSLRRCTSYQVALRVKYACGVWSNITNIASATTLCSGYSIPADCGGGLQSIAPKTEEDALPLQLALAVPRPNPSSGRTQFDFAIPADHGGKPFDLSVFDVSGRRVSVVDHGMAVAGRQLRSWDGRGLDGHPLRSGMYFVRFVIGDETLTRSVLLER